MSRLTELRSLFFKKSSDRRIDAEKPDSESPLVLARRDARRRYVKDASRRRADDMVLVETFERRVLAAFDLIQRHVQKNDDDSMRRAADLIDWLNRRSPRAIHELGSGRSSVIFAVWAARNNARHVAFEEDPRWAELTKEAIAVAGGTGDVVLAEAVRSRTAVRYAQEIPWDADFIYVDGPQGGGKIYATPDKRPCCMDIIGHLRAGARPRTILVDGRLNTCRELLAHREIAPYTVFPQYHLAAELSFPGQEMYRHTAFVL